MTFTMNRETMPIIIMAGNDLKEPDEKTKKEWYFLESMALYQVQLIRMDSEQRVTQF